MSCSKSDEYIPISINEKQDISLLTKSFNESFSINEEAYPDRIKTPFTFPNGLKVQKMDSLYIFGGDIVLPQNIVDSLLNLSFVNRSAISSLFDKYWYRGKVYYTIDNNFSGRSELQIAFSHWTEMAGIEFVPRVDQRDFIKFTSVSGNGNYSEGIGRKGGQQIINIEPGERYGTMIHEIGHAVGLYHEHKRKDRDNYVNINFNLIPDEWKYQYEKYSPNDGHDVGFFDFNSIMLYDSYLHGTAVMFDKSNNVFYTQRSYLSPGDIVGVKYVYGPPYMKIETRLVSSQSNYDPSGAFDEYSASYDNVIYFYSDKLFTTQMSSDCYRKILVRYENYREENGSVSHYDEVQEIIIQPGLSNYQLPYTHMDYMSEYGYTRYDYKDSYNISGVGF